MLNLFCFFGSSSTNCKNEKTACRSNIRCTWIKSWQNPFKIHRTLPVPGFKMLPRLQVMLWIWSLKDSRWINYSAVKISTSGSEFFNTMNWKKSCKIYLKNLKKGHSSKGVSYSTTWNNSTTGLKITDLNASN